MHTRIGKCNLKHLYTGETFNGKVGKHRIRNKAVIYTTIGKCNLNAFGHRGNISLVK